MNTGALIALIVGTWFLSSSDTLLRLQVPEAAFRNGVRAIIFLVLALCLSGCGMLLTINPIGMLGIVHHKSHGAVAAPCRPKDIHCIDDSWMRRH